MSQSSFEARKVEIRLTIDHDSILASRDRLIWSEHVLRRELDRLESEDNL